jgi:predicted membrane protein
MIMIGAGTFGLATVANVCMLFISASNPRWLTFGHAFFGIGAFVAPFIIMAVELNMFYINFACYALVVVACLLIKTPKHEANSNDRSSDSQATR